MLDITQIHQPPNKSAAAVAERAAKQKNSGAPEPDTTPPPILVRLHNPQARTQILVNEAKAARLIAKGAYIKGALPE